MIPLYVFLTLASIGYIFSKGATVSQSGRMHTNHNESPSMNSIYESSYLDRVRAAEARAASATFNQSLKPNSNVVGATYREDVAARKASQVVKSNLAGIEIPTAEFTHNNQTPFFGSKVRQNTDPFANAPVMERFTGDFDNAVWKKKKEIEPLFKPNTEVNYVNGAPVRSDRSTERYEVGHIRNNERPFEQINVGPGLDSGYNATPTGGFQQFERDFIMPKNVDSLRVLTNQKETFEGRVVEGAGIGQRGQQSKVDKNRADTYFENSSDRYFTTTGASVAQTQRPEYEVKDTNRVDTSMEYVGDAYGASKAQKMDPLVRDTTRQQLNEFGFRNADLDKMGKGDNYDFGKDTFDLPPNERDVTGLRTYDGNIGTSTKAMTAPLEDIFKDTRKEYTVQHPRQFGSLNPQFPDKITVKDPNDVARTTIKETNIHDTSTGRLRGPNKSVVYDPDEIAKRTIRETNSDVDVALNVSGAEYRGQAYDPDAKAKTTHKETLIDEKRNGSIQSLERRNAGYEVNDVTAPTTQKEFTSDNDYFGSATYTNADGYKVASTFLPTTQKQHISDNDHYGGAGSVQYKRPMSKEDIENARLNELREGTLEGRVPTAQGAKVAASGEAVNVKIRRIDSDNVNQRATYNMDKVKNAMLPTEAFRFTKERNLSDLDHVERLDINTIAPLKSNPYAMRPLHAT